MRIEVDGELCAAHGECVLAAPMLFALGDDDDVARVLEAEPHEHLRAAALAAADGCPARAITVTDRPS